MTRTRVAQVVSLACAHHIPCVILMRSCCMFASLRQLHFRLFAVFLLFFSILSFLLAINFIFHDCGGQISCALQRMRTLALLPSTTLSQHVDTTQIASKDGHLRQSAQSIRSSCGFDYRKLPDDQRAPGKPVA